VIKAEKVVQLMDSVRIEIEVPKSLLNYIDYNDKNNLNKLSKLMLYQLIKEGKISFGKAAEILGMNKITFITDLGKMGMPYFDSSIDEVMEDAKNVGIFMEDK
jgi:predicted HTH domain antitoxin